MSWILWAMLLSFGCIFLVFLMSCLWIAKDADENIDQLERSRNIKNERLKENIHMGMHIGFHTTEIAGPNSESPNMEINRQAKQGVLAA